MPAPDSETTEHGLVFSEALAEGADVLKLEAGIDRGRNFAESAGEGLGRTAEAGAEAPAYR